MPVKKRLRLFAFTALAILLFLIMAAILVPTPPHGRFATPDVGSQGDSYFEFATGEVRHVVFTGEQKREGEEIRMHIGSYRGDKGRWLSGNSNGTTSELRATLFSLRIAESDGTVSGPFYRYWDFAKGTGTVVYRK